MRTNVTFQHLGHEAVHGSPCGAHDLQDFWAIALFVEGSYQRFDLSLDAFGAVRDPVPRLGVYHW